MIVGSVCLSHSPLRERCRPNPETETRFDSALKRLADFVSAQTPDVVVIFYPDHLNGFSYGLLPSFCIGLGGGSIGDYGTAAGKLEIPEDQANALARFVLDAGVDIAVSHNMQVDHGGVQPLEWLSEEQALPQVIPIFVNCAAAPLPTFARARALGRAVGDWARQTSARVLLIGSGGLSHDPPVPALATATPEVRDRLIKGSALTHGQRFTRQSRARAEGVAMAAGTSSLTPVNADWDRALMNAFVAGDLEILDGASDHEITAKGGRGGHEARAWIAALAALGSGYSAEEVYYEPIDEWITGMGMLQAVAA